MGYPCWTLANVAFTLDGFWFIFIVSLFNYNTLTNIPIPVDIIPSLNPNIPLSSAIPAAELALNGTHNNSPQSHAIYWSPLVYAIQIQNKDIGTWVEAYINAHSGTFMGLTNFVNKADHRILPIMKETAPEGFETLVNPQNVMASGITMGLAVAPILREWLLLIFPLRCADIFIVGIT